LCFINKIDATKTNESFIEGVPTLNLYLQYSDIECPNCKIERNNGKIKSLMNRSFGFTNLIRTRNRILYSLNSDEPVSSKRQYKSNRRHKTKN